MFIMGTTRRYGIGRALAGLVAVSLLGLTPVVVVREASGANCSYDVIYQSKDLTFQIGPSIVSVEVNMVKHYTQVRWSCVEYNHKMTMHTFAPSQWTLNTLGGDANVQLTVQQPSWSLIWDIGTWTVQPPYVYITLGAGGSGTNFVRWDATLYWPSPSGYATLGSYQTSVWGSQSGHWGQAYPVTFTLHNNIPGGETNVQTLTMTG